MVKPLFGTDGIRAEVGSEKMLPPVVMRLGWAFGMVLNERQVEGPVFVAKDTRLSGYMLESALESGLSAAGRDIRLLGPLPTPAVSVLVKQMDAAGAVIISASHNPYNYNGLKFFGLDGCKLDSRFQRDIEKWTEKDFYCPDPSALGRASRIVDATERYVDHLISAQNRVFNLSRMRLIFDGANGAAYRAGPQLFRRLQAEVRALSCRPDGLNINRNCGSTSVSSLRREVLKRNAHYGIATDGDADRLYMVDQAGVIYDGDMLLYALCASLHQRQEMKGGVVGTVQSNQGLERGIKDLGYAFERTPVGDRYVCEHLRKNDWLIGGEPSGHLIHRGLADCSDGLLIAVHLLGFLQESSQTLADITEDLQIMPSLQVNIDGRWPGTEAQLLAQAPLRSYLESLDRDKYRVVVRPSGTEAVVRVLVESAQESENKKIIHQLEKIVSALIVTPSTR
ncbi:MAG: phosphoglucosamine mutase [Proteobacteria bacterium]|nr:phosphoglucosamine mutase [Pseudomonadota bacterium]